MEFTNPAQAPYTKLAQVHLDIPDSDGWDVEDLENERKPFLVGATFQDGRWFTLGFIENVGERAGLARLHESRATCGIHAAAESLEDFMHEWHLSGWNPAVMAVVF